MSASLTSKDILALDKSGALASLKSELATLDTSTRKAAPVLGMLRFQVKKTEGDLASVTKSFPKESLAPSALRNAIVFESVFRDFVLAGRVTESAYLAYSFADCRALIESHKLANLAAKMGGASNLKALDVEKDTIASGAAPADVLKAVKKSAKRAVTAENKKAKESEAARETRENAARAEKEAFAAWKANGAIQNDEKDGWIILKSDSPPPPAIKEAAPMAEFIKSQIDAMPARQRKLMPDMLRALADFMERDASAAPADNVIPMQQAA